MDAQTGRPEVVLVLASARNDVIGLDGDMPWHLPADLAHFKALTLEGTILMGRRTFDSLGTPPRPLPRRRNLVLTRDPNWTAEGVEVVHSVDEALSCGAQTLFVIGGAQIYAQFAPWAQRLEWTRIEASPEGDTRFRPDTQGFRLDKVVERPSDERNAHSLRFESWCRDVP